MKNVDVFVFVHDEQIIIEFEKQKKFEKTFGKDYKWVFLGNNPCSIISDRVIIARDLSSNIEQHKKLVTYTGWHALVNNSLITKPYTLLLEYDVTLSDKFIKITEQTMKTAKHKEVFSFIPVAKDFLFYEYLQPLFDCSSEWSQEDFKACREDFILRYKTEKWMGSSNSIWLSETLINFVDWFDDFIESETDFVSYEGIGHLVERALTVYCVNKDIKYNFISNVLEHHYLDSHQTQAKHNYGVQKDYKQWIGAISKR